MLLESSFISKFRGGSGLLLCRWHVHVFPHVATEQSYAILQSLTVARCKARNASFSFAVKWPVYSSRDLFNMQG